MRQKNRLYTVNKYNRQLFTPEENLFLWGGLNQGSFFQHQGEGIYGNAQNSYTAPVVTTPISGSLTRKSNIFNTPALTASNIQTTYNFNNPLGMTAFKTDVNQTAKNAQNNYRQIANGFGTDQEPQLADINAGTSKDPGLIGMAANLGATALSSKGKLSGLFGKGGAGWGIAGAAAGILGSINTGERRGMWDTLDPMHHLASGRESAAGNAMGDTGVALTQAGLSTGQPYLALAGAGLKVLGELTNASFGMKTDKEKLKRVNEGIADYNTFTGATSLDDIKDVAAHTNANDVYEDGWFTSKGSKMQEDLERRFKEARAFAYNNQRNNINNLINDQINMGLANYTAYGGPLSFGGGALDIMQQNRYFDTIDKRSEAIANKGQNVQTGFTGGAKTFGDGGLKAAFLDEFGSDPIGAAIRYNQGLEALAAQEEAKEIEAAREAEYLAMQKRLADLETGQQGLQALVGGLSSTSNLGLAGIPEVEPEVEYKTEEAPASLPSPSKAASKVRGKNSNWDYIENALRKSGKFNDVQIEGIKYNLQRESAIDPSAVGDGGKAFGLGQWHGSRQPKDTSLKGQTQHLIDTMSNFDGNEHWIGRGNYEGFMNARTPEEAHYYIAKGYERPHKDIVAKVKRDSDMSLRKIRAFGGELGTNGTDWTNGLLYIDEGGSHESNPLDGVPMGLDPEGIPNLVEEGETVYNDYVFSDRMNVPDFMLKDLGLPKSKKGISFADASKKLAQESKQRPNDPISQDGLQASLSRLAEIQEAERMKKQAKEYQGLEHACGGKLSNKYGEGNKMRRSSDNPYGNLVDKIKFDPDKAAAELEATMQRDAAQPVITDAVRQAIAMDGYQQDMGLKPAIQGAPAIQQEGIKEGYDPYPTWMRYAPVVGAGAMALTDMLGITNKPDYTYADKLDAMATRAGYAPNIKYNPIGNYLRYNPMDIWFEQNRMDANSRATDRAILNSASPSRMAGLLANSYNNQIADGNLYRQALEYNDAKRERVADFNRRTNMFNSQMGLEAAMANARYHQAARQMGLSGLAQAAALRDSIDARTGAARSANLTNFLTSLGNIGRENFALNQINSDRSRQYGVYRNGVSEHKRSSKGKKGSRWT